MALTALSSAVFVSAAAEAALSMVRCAAAAMSTRMLWRFWAASRSSMASPSRSSIRSASARPRRAGT